MTWNANRIHALGKNRALHLSQLFEDESVNVACITETRLKPMQKLHISAFSVYRNDRPEFSGGGVAIAIKKSIRHKAISTPIPSLQTSGVLNNDEPLRIITCYLPIRTNNISEISLTFELDQVNPYLTPCSYQQASLKVEIIPDPFQHY